MPAPVIVVEQGKNTAPREHLWSMMVSIASWPSLLGSPVMRSMVTQGKGFASMEEGILNKGILARWVRFLFCWQVAQPLMYSVIHVRAPGQKYSLLICQMVSSLPGCPFRGPSCHEFMSLRLSP